jgi:hypothetical protein
MTRSNWRRVGKAAGSAEEEVRIRWTSWLRGKGPHVNSQEKIMEKQRKGAKQYRYNKRKLIWVPTC